MWGLEAIRGILGENNHPAGSQAARHFRRERLGDSCL
jgi:hypothetical protein